MDTFGKNKWVKVIRVDAEQHFQDYLRGEADPKVKHKIIGNTCFDVFHKQAVKLSAANGLAQGMIYPSVIGSAAAAHGKVHVIKPHHKDLHFYTRVAVLCKRRNEPCHFPLIGLISLIRLTHWFAWIE